MGLIFHKDPGHSYVSPYFIPQQATTPWTSSYNVSDKDFGAQQLYATSSHDNKTYNSPNSATHQAPSKSAMPRGEGRMTLGSYVQEEDDEEEEEPQEEDAVVFF
jgi:hypothetical protein